MFEDISVRKWIQNWDNGTPIDVWYDWFCSEASLPRKTKALVPKVKRIAKSPKINQDTMYVWFKNNCPIPGHLYDDFRFADRKTGNVIYTIVPKSGFDIDKGCAFVSGINENGVWQHKLVIGTWKDVLKFFGV